MNVQLPEPVPQPLDFDVSQLATTTRQRILARVRGAGLVYEILSIDANITDRDKVGKSTIFERDILKHYLLYLQKTYPAVYPRVCGMVVNKLDGPGYQLGLLTCTE